MFNRENEARIFVKIYNEVQIIEDDYKKAKELLVQRDVAKIGCACNLLSLNMFDDCKQLLVILSAELQQENQFEYMNLAAKYFRLTKQWLPLAVSLVNCCKLNGFSKATKTYAVEAKLLSMAMDFYVHQNELEMVCND